MLQSELEVLRLAFQAGDLDKRQYDDRLCALLRRVALCQAAWAGAAGA
eukprot:gene314-5288_t